MKLHRLAVGALVLALAFTAIGRGVARAWDCAEGTASRSTSDGDGNTQPTIRIKARRIYVAQFEWGSCAQVEGTRLSGSGGDYYFTDGGWKDIEPGTYRHWVVGRVTKGPTGYPCSGLQQIESLVCYR